MTAKFRVLVADDEYIIRRGIIRFLRKYEEMEVVAEAEDGEEALEEAKAQPVDVAFVDINMPFLNGLEFIREFKKIQPQALLVVITGYDEFEYARDALRLGVFEYMLKPLMEDSFDQMVESVIRELSEKKTTSQYLEWAKSMMKQNRKQMMEDVLIKWAEGHLAPEEVTERIRYMEMKLPAHILVTYIHFTKVETVQVEDGWNDDLLYYAAQNIVNEIYNGMEEGFICRNTMEDLLLISDAGQEDRRRECKENLERFLPVRVFMAEQPANELGRVPEVYRNLQEEAAKQKGHSSMMKSVKEYIEENYMREEFSLVEAADSVHLSPQHFSRMFRKEMQVTFVDYLTRVRIRKAIGLFGNDELKMYEIAESVGYSTQHYFSSVFKKNMGVSPLEYRKMIKRD